MTRGKEIAVDETKRRPDGEPERGKWTEAQFQAITTRDKTLLLSAAAGSGKTTTLTERVIRLLTDRDDPRDVSRMVIVTFTVAAANDLKDKLTKALNEAIRKDPSDRRLPEQLLLLADADIGTIDGFCRRIVTEFSDCAGISPNYRVCDPNEEAHLLRFVLDPFIDRLFAGDEPGVGTAEEFCDFVSTVVESRSQEDLSKIVLAVWEQVQNCPEGADKLDVCADYIEEVCNLPPERTVFGKALLERVAERFSDVPERARALLASLSSAPAVTQDALRQPIEALSLAVRVFTDPKSAYDAVRSAIFAAADAAIPAFRSNSKFVAQADPDFVSEAKAFLYGVRAAADDFKPLFLSSSADWKTEAEEHLKTSRLLARLIRRFDELVAAEKKRRNVASFADVERAALAILVSRSAETGKFEKTAVAREIASRYDEVFVDEYQDVNPIQHAIFEAISGERNRFLVGDVKQSIYLFRRAEPKIFTALKAAFPPLDEAGDRPAASLFLSENFRCDKPIVDFANGVFDKLFGATGASIGYCDGDRLRFAKPAEKCSPEPILPVVRMFKDPVTEDGDAPAEDAECAWVADEIARLTSEGNRADGAPITPDDVAILLRTEKHATAFRAALAKRGIPVSVETKVDFFDAPEIRLALCLLNAVDNPRRDVPLVGLLLSPLCEGFTPDLLVSIRREASVYDEPFYDALVEYCDRHPDFAPGARFLSQLASFRRAAEGMPVDRLIQKLFTETGLLPIGGAANRENGRENLLLFYQYARAFEATSFRGLYRFIAYVNDLAADGQKLGLQPPANVKGVHIMTIHHSKGLEFPVVFVARTLGSRGGGRGLTSDGNVSLTTRFGLTVKVRDKTGLARIETPFRRIAEQEKKLLESEEALRVLYVALTRARERLYVTGLLRRDRKVAKKREKYRDASPLTAHEVLSESAPFDLILRAIGGEDSKLATVILPPDEENEAAVVSPAEPAATKAPKPKKAPPVIRGDDGEEISEEDAEKILKDRFAYRYEFPWLGTVPGKLSVSVLSPAVLDGADETTAVLTPRAPREAPPLPHFLSGAKKPVDPTLRGTATHEFLQFCDLGKVRENGVEAELDRLISGGFLTKETRDLVNLPELELFRSSSLADEMLGARWMRRELRFNMILPASRFTEDPELKKNLKDQTVLVQGIMDCVFLTEADELVLLDYKTDRLRGGIRADDDEIAAFVGRHRDQLGYYALAVEKMLGRKPDRILLYPLCLGRPIRVSLPDAEL